MKKLRYLFIFLALLLILSIVLVSARFIDNKNTIEAVDKETSEEETVGKATVQEGLEKIKNIVGTNHGSIEYKSIYEIAEKELYQYKDNLYEYYIDPNTKNFVGMIAMGELLLKKRC